MIRGKILSKKQSFDRYFRWRGDSVSRIEGFSDSVFAFAVTLLVVSLAAPQTFSELLNIIRGFISFGICFALLLIIWYKHFLFFRRYGISNVPIIVYNSILLFVMIFYIYPLKFLFTLLINLFLPFTRADNFSLMITNEQVPTLMIVYGLGCFLTFSVFFLMYRHAFKNRVQLDLNEIEIAITKSEIRESIIYMAIPLLSIIMVHFGGNGFESMSGWIYMSFGPLLAANGILNGRKIKKMSLDDNSSPK